MLARLKCDIVKGMKSRAFAFEFIFRIFLLCAFFLCAQLARATDYIYDASTLTWNTTPPTGFSFSSGDTVTITSSGTNSVSISYPITVPEGVTYIIDSSANITISNNSFIVNGKLIVNGTFYASQGITVGSTGNVEVSSIGNLGINGTASNSGTITNSGTLSQSGSSFQNTGTIINTGTATFNNGIENTGTITNKENASIEAQSLINKTIFYLVSLFVLRRVKVLLTRQNVFDLRKILQP